MRVRPGSKNRAMPRARGRIVLALALALVCSGSFSAEPAPSATQSAKTVVTFPAPNKTYGSSSAPITMDIFTDYQCPTCRAFYDQTLRELIRTYVASGKVYLVHHDFPLQMHKYSGEAARWANACAEVGQFEAVEGVLYDNQDAWGNDGNIAKYVATAMPPADFKRVEAIMKNSPMPAPQAKYPASDPMAGVTSACPMDRFIVQDIQAGYGINTPGTPAFVVSYKGHAFQPIYSAVSWPVLKQLFDSLLKQ